MPPAVIPILLCAHYVWHFIFTVRFLTRQREETRKWREFINSIRFKFSTVRSFITYLEGVKGGMEITLTYGSPEVQAPIKINMKPDFLVQQWYLSVFKESDENETFIDQQTSTLKATHLPGIAFTLNAQWLQKFVARFGHLDGAPQQLSAAHTALQEQIAYLTALPDEIGDFHVHFGPVRGWLWKVLVAWGWLGYAWICPLLLVVAYFCKEWSTMIIGLLVIFVPFYAIVYLIRGAEWLFRDRSKDQMNALFTEPTETK